MATHHKGNGTKLIAFLALVAAVVLLAGCTTNGTGGAKGTTYFTITDASADTGPVSAVKMTITGISVMNSDGGWVTVSSTPQTFDLLKLKSEGAQALLAQASLPAGTYEQVRLSISSVAVTDSTGDHAAKLPSSELKFVGGFTVDAGSTSSVNVDFVASDSVHLASSGSYVVAPVLHVETRDGATVDASDATHVAVSGGAVQSSATFGMDVSGAVRENGGIPVGATVDDTSNPGQIHVISNNGAPPIVFGGGAPVGGPAPGTGSTP